MSAFLELKIHGLEKQIQDLNNLRAKADSTIEALEQENCRLDDKVAELTSKLNNAYARLNRLSNLDHEHDCCHCDEGKIAQLEDKLKKANERILELLAKNISLNVPPIFSQSSINHVLEENRKLFSENERIASKLHQTKELLERTIGIKNRYLDKLNQINTLVSNI